MSKSILKSVSQPESSDIKNYQCTHRLDFVMCTYVYSFAPIFLCSSVVESAGSMISIYKQDMSVLAKVRASRSTDTEIILSNSNNRIVRYISSP